MLLFIYLVRSIVHLLVLFIGNKWYQYTMALCFDAKSYDEAMDEIEDYLNENAKPNKKCKKC